MEIKGTLTANNSSKLEAPRLDETQAKRARQEGSMEDLRYYLACPLRKNHARIPVTVCHKQRCLFLGSKDGKLICTYSPRSRSGEAGGDPNARK